MSNLLPPNSTDLEHNVADIIERVTALPTPMRDLWNPTTCPAELLPWLAWSLSVDNWQPYYDEQTKRQTIRSAVAVQRKKGTAYAVRTAVASFGAGVSIREWWQTSPQGTPHTFELIVVAGSGAANNAQLQNDIVAEVNRVKPVRSHFTLTAGLAALGSVGLFSAARPVLYRRLSMTE